ncbi:MAG: hypothetical protein RXR41_01070 [Candidatus Marsarchaeota archaeon]|jgi:uncharacterized membrane protein
MSLKDRIRDALSTLYSPDTSDSLWRAAEVLALLAVAFLIGGGVYVLYYGYPFAIYSSSQVYYVYPGNIEVGAEVIIMATFLLMGASGFYLIYRASENVEDPEVYQQMLYVGIALVVITFLGLFAIANMK